MLLSFLETDLTASLVVLLAVFVVTYLLRSNRGKYKTGDRKLPPSLPAFPIVGSLPFLVGCNDMCEYFSKKVEQLGSVFSLYAGSRYVVVLNGRQAIHEALVKRGTHFADRTSIYSEELANPHRKGLAFHPYDTSFKHYQQLSLSILKQFGFGMRLMETRIQVEVETFIDQLKAVHGTPCDPDVFIIQSVSNITMSILFGRRFDVNNEPRYAQHIADVHTLGTDIRPECALFPMLRFLPKYKRLADNILASNTRQIAYIHELVNHITENVDSPSCFVSSFVDAEGSDFDRLQLAFIIRDLMAGGFETTTTTLLWAIIALTNRPAIQQRMHDELNSTLGRDRAPCLDDRKSLPYVQAVVAEIMRYRTLLVTAVPHATINDTEVNGYFIPAKSLVLVNLQSVHMDPETWTDPECFRPERFLNDAGEVFNTENVIPFSLGKRSCPGEQLARQQVFLFLSRFIQLFQLLPPDGVTWLCEDSAHLGSLVNAPHKFHVRFISRQ